MNQIAMPSHERMPAALLMANDEDRLPEALLVKSLVNSGLNYATLLRPYYAEPELLVFEERDGHAVGREAILELLVRLVQEHARDNCVGHYTRATEAIPELQETRIKGVYDYTTQVPWAVECVRCGATGKDWADVSCPICGGSMVTGNREPITDYFGPEYGPEDGAEYSFKYDGYRNVWPHRCLRCKYAVITLDKGQYVV